MSIPPSTMTTRTEQVVPHLLNQFDKREREMSSPSLMTKDNFTQREKPHFCDSNSNLR